MHAAPYFDDTLADRIDEARDEWLEKAQEAFDEKIDPSLIEEIRSRAEATLQELREKIDQMQVAVDDLDIELPPIEVPEAELDDVDGPDPLVTSEMDLVEAIEILRARKDYKNGGAP